MSTLDDGYCALVLKDSDTECRVSRSDYERIRGEWMSAKTFIEIVSIDGIVGVIKSASIVLIEDISPEALQSWRDRQKVEKAQDMVEGT